MIDVIDSKQLISYTNKDFESIYVELLDLVKELTYKWDPSVSNESDPGVILLKLNAIIADKCNYNIDQNVLECFPLSVTQEANARQLFEQLGYFMHWYRSAVTSISLKWIGDEDTAQYTIPKFTMVSDYDNSVIYTLVGPFDGVINDYFTVASQKLSCEGDITTFKAIQGIAVEYDINGDTLITPDKLDSNNRLYFDGTDIAENGIFITNVDKQNYSEWKRKDNLLVETLGNRYYKFGVSKDMDSCYLEFPDDVTDLIGEGINITYIQTDGEYGNVAAQIIEKFYNDVTPEESTTDNPITLNSDNVSISNAASATNGTNYQSINDAYKQYKKTIGTFNTLITLRDYMNVINNSGLVSNGFVCDRTNDVQNTYSVMSTINDANQQITQIEADESDEPLLTAFSLKLYLLQYVENVTDLDSYNQTFELMKNSELENVKAYIADLKAIPHDYVDIQPATSTAAHFCFFKNKYPIDCNILTQYALTSAEASELVDNIRLALYENLNSKEINFGDEVTLDLVYDIVTNADERIKAAIIDNLVYTTYAVYFDGNEYQEIEISSADIDPVDYEVMYNVPEFDNDNSYDTDSIVMYNGHRYICVSHKDTGMPWSEADWKLYEISVTTNESTFTQKIGINNYEQQTFVYIEDAWTQNGEIVNLTDFGIQIDGYVEDGDVITASVSIKTQLRDEIYAKSVLSGATQFFIKAEPFNYNLNQIITQQVDNVEKISSNVDIVFNQSNPIYTLKDNESLQFYAPNLIDSTEYSNYVRYEYYIKDAVSANTDYQLKANEFIIFYWKEEDNKLALYEYAAYGEGNIIKPSFELEGKGSDRDAIGISIANKLKADGSTIPECRNLGTTTDPKYVLDSEHEPNYIDIQLSENIGTISTYLSGSKKIVTREMNKITLDSTYYCYWVLNDKVNNKYRLFESNPEDPTAPQSVLLKNGEYFFYSSSALSDLIILGSGTEIVRSNSSNNWEVDVLPTDEILTQGTNALKNLWMKVPSGTTIEVVENQYLTVGPGCMVKIETASQQDVYDLTVVTENATVDKATWFESDLKNDTQIESIYEFIYSGTSWTLNDKSVSLSTYGITPSFVSPQEGDEIDIKVTRLWEIAIDNTGATSTRSISDFKISYSTDKGVSYTTLDDISLVSHDGWRIMSLLAITISPTEPQVLLDGQTITYYIKDNPVGNKIVGQNEVDNKYPVVLLSSLKLDSDGSGMFGTSYIDDYGQTIYLSLYQYEELLSDNQAGIRFYGEDSVIFDFEPIDNEKAITFSIPVGEYILKLSNPTGILETVQLELDGQLLHAMHDTEANNFNAFGTHYIYMNLAEQTEHTLTVKISEHSEKCTLTINNCYRYTYPTGMSLEYFNKIYNLINKLDKQKHSFDYTLEVDEDENIENPLAAKSFFKSNHIYNQFTICQLDASKNSKIYVTGKK